MDSARATPEKSFPADLQVIETASGRPVACRHRPGTGPGLVFLPGYASDMDGAKAVALDAFAAANNAPIVRFDYSGTGSSPGRFEDGTLASWLDDALAVVDRLCSGPAIAIGSSMGGWLALHLALRRPDRIKGIVGIAAAPDFTSWGFDAEQKQEIKAQGELRRSNAYGSEPQLTTLAFWQSGEALTLLKEPIAITCPVRLVHGDNDQDVPLPVALQLVRQLRSDNVQLTVIKGGGHRLSEPHEISTILRSTSDLLELAR